MKVLIVGINGFLGRNVASELIGLGWQVEGVYRRQKQFIPKNILVYPESKLPGKKYDAIILAAGNHQMGFNDLCQTNINLPNIIVEKYPDARIIYISSIVVYGENPRLISEKASIDSPLVYGKAKITGENIVRSVHDYIILRLANLYGVGMMDSLFIPTIIKNAVTNHQIVISDNKNKNYLHIKDAIRLIIKSITAEKGVYLGLGNNIYSNNEVGQLVVKLVPNTQVNYIDKKTYKSPKMDNKYTQKILGWKPEISLLNGLKEMIMYA
jgi:nucleoside-diphosphate-sugar epimerase